MTRSVPTPSVEAGRQAPLWLPRVSSAALVARLDVELVGASDPVLAFDADGTLWSGDVGIDLFEALLRSRAIRPEARDALAADAESLGLGASSTADGAVELATALYAALERGEYDEERAFAMMAWVFAGFTERELDTFAARVLDEVAIDERIHPEVRPVLAWAEARGVDVLVVSASPRAVVVAGVARLGLPADRVLAMTPRVTRDGCIAPELAFPPVYGEGKVAAIDAHRPGAAVLAAFGDSAFDAAMLRRARLPVAVSPGPGLLGVAQGIPGLSILEA